MEESDSEGARWYYGGSNGIGLSECGATAIYDGLAKDGAGVVGRVHLSISIFRVAVIYQEQPPHVPRPACKLAPPPPAISIKPPFGISISYENGHGCSTVSTIFDTMLILQTLLMPLLISRALNFNRFIDQVGRLFFSDAHFHLVVTEGQKTGLNFVLSCKQDERTRAWTVQECPTQKEASRGYDYCMLRFSNRNILGSMDDGFVYATRNETNQTAQFNDVLGSLLSGLRRRAPSDGE
ncbi:hypothetical protein RJ639_042783 [Escallonia herrerae]|uniref:Uncharacterized protein n=1 Tax=Escallonia herrerae TaxID=1293975 RepID=A0AA89B9H9_9ASTE|nr:hypothetical protein RJ639_042783 [Escallonia herrerae]